MKLFRKIDLQWRITLMTACILILVSVSLTIFSIRSADELLDVISTVDVSDYPEENYPTAIPSSGSAWNSNHSSDPEASISNAPTQVYIYKQGQFNVKGIILCVITVLMGTLAIYFISGKALKPLKELDKQVSEIDENNLSFRFKENGASDEVQHLTTGFNHMLQRLEDAFLRQKRLTASVAHELITPLTTMKAGMQVLKQDKNATVNDYLENIDLSIKNIDRLSSIVNDLLLIAMAQENGHKAYEEIYLDIMFDTIISDLSQVYKENNISFSSNLQENVILGQPAMIYRALYNLIENAYKYNVMNGSIIVKSYSDEEHSYIEIADTGKGMEENQLPLIFDAFYRIDNSRSRKIAGAGLGLSLVKTIITNHNGKIDVVSKTDRGTTFTITLPKDIQ